jgi:hypothetical protein
VDNVRRAIAELENCGFYRWDDAVLMRECGKFNLDRCIVRIDNMEPDNDKVCIWVPIDCIHEFFGNKED